MLLRGRDPSTHPSVYKVKAHLTEAEAEAAGIQPNIFFGNFLADVLADKFADNAELPHSIIGNYELHGKLAWRIQNRLICTNRLHLELAPPVPVVTRVRKPRPAKGALLASTIAASAHDAVLGAFGCAQCRRCGSKSTALAVRSWLRTPCAPMVAQHFAAGGALARAPAGHSLVIGSVTVHASHTVLSRRGIAWCSACGSYSTSTSCSKSGTKGLGKPCIGVATRGGQAALNRLARGDPPRPGMAWPEA